MNSIDLIRRGYRVCIALQLGFGTELPDSVPGNYESDEDFLKKMHHVMLEVMEVDYLQNCSYFTSLQGRTDGR